MKNNNSVIFSVKVEEISKMSDYDLECKKYTDLQFEFFINDIKLADISIYCLESSDTWFELISACDSKKCIEHEYNYDEGNGYYDNSPHIKISTNDVEFGVYGELGSCCFNVTHDIAMKAFIDAHKITKEWELQRERILNSKRESDEESSDSE